MKNKRLIWTLVFLAILTLSSIGTDLFEEHQNANKGRQVGILQFVLAVPADPNRERY